MGKKEFISLNTVILNKSIKYACLSCRDAVFYNLCCFINLVTLLQGGRREKLGLYSSVVMISW